MQNLPHFFSSFLLSLCVEHFAMPDFIFLSRFVSIDQRFSESVERKEDSLLADREVTGKLLLIAWLDGCWRLPTTNFIDRRLNNQPSRVIISHSKSCKVSFLLSFVTPSPLRSHLYQSWWKSLLISMVPVDFVYVLYLSFKYNARLFKILIQGTLNL